MLLIALGLVIVAMRQLNSPSTAEQLGQFFAAPESQVEQEADSAIVSVATPLAIEKREMKPLDDAASPSSPDRDRSDALQRVQDNTYFRPAEREAWFGLFERLLQQDAQQLRKQSQGELTYAQLLKQPEVYRGQVVTVRGTLKREEVETAPENSLGIASYHRLVMQPRGGGHWPFIVYSLDLPSQLPRGDSLRESISVSGYFFKNWSYAWQDGLGVAPVILARGVNWQPTPRPTGRRTPMNRIRFFLATCGFIGVAILVAVFVRQRGTRRPLQIHKTSEAIHEQLQRLAESEAQE